MSSYCDIAPGHPFHGPYHGREYGFPSRDDKVLFERLILEINQAGLSWLTILKKREAFLAAFDGFDIDKVAAYGAREKHAPAGRCRDHPQPPEGRRRHRERQAPAGRSAQNHGSFAAWLDHHHPLDKADWVKLFKKTFRFTGGEIVGEFLMSLGYLPGAHAPGCPVAKKIARLGPPWAKAEKRAKAKRPAKR